MTMRIGHTLFGGTVAGLVIASGVALCMSSANAINEVNRYSESSTVALATGTGFVEKKTFPAAQTVNCLATTQGSCVVEFKPLPVEITATAVANGSPKAYYFTYSFTDANALTVAKAVRKVRIYPYRGRAFSYAQGDGESWQIGYTKTAFANANGFGTTYHVGSSNAVAKATITCRPSLKIGAYGNSVAIAEVVVTGQYTIGVTGLATAVADLCADSAVTVNNIRIFTANGTGKCVADIEAQTVGVYQSQTGNCYANIDAIPKIQAGGKGKGFAIANGVGDSVGIATGAVAIEGNTSAIAFGTLKYTANAYSQCLATAISNGNGKLTQTRVESKFGKAIAVSTGYGFNIKRGSVDAYSKCLITAAATKTISVSTAKTSAISTGELNTAVLGVIPKSALAVSTLKNKVKRTVSAYSSTVAEATALGYMQVNDLQEAPESRTYIVEQSVRLTIVSEEPRLVVV